MGTEQGGWRMPASVSKEETSLSPFTFLQHAKAGVAVLHVVPCAQFSGVKGKGTKPA